MHDQPGFHEEVDQRVCRDGGQDVAGCNHVDKGQQEPQNRGGQG